MSDEIVGHKTFSDGHGGFRHEPLTKAEADALWARAQELKEKRASDYPDAQACVNAIWDACQRLEELGWKLARLAPQDRKVRQTISLGSTGIHDAYCEQAPEPISPRHWWWHQSEDGDLWPHEPIYFKDKTDGS